MSVNTSFPEYQNCQLTPDIRKKLRRKARQAQAAAGKSSSVPEMEVVGRFRMSSANLLKGSLYKDFPKDHIFTKADYQTVLTDYIAEKGLTEGKKRDLVRMDECLARSFFSSSTGKRSQKPVSEAEAILGKTIRKSELMQRLHKSFRRVYALRGEGQELEDLEFKTKLPTIAVKEQRIKRFFVTK